MKPGRFVSYSLLYIGVLMFAGFLFAILFQNVERSLQPLLAMGVGLISVFNGLHRIRRPELKETPKKHGIVTVLACFVIFGMTAWFLSVTVL